MTVPYPIVAQHELDDPDRRGPLGLMERRKLEDIPKIKPHEVLVWRVGSRYIMDRRELRAHDDTVIHASSVSVVSVRPDTEVEVSFLIDAQDAAEFRVKVTFICSVLDPVVVVRDGQVNAADALIAYLRGYQDLFNLGLEHPIKEINKLRTKMAIQVKSYMTLRPPKIPGMGITSATVQIETPTVLADIGKLTTEQEIELRKQNHAALLDSNRQTHILEKANRMEVVGRNPESALGLAYADGGMTSPEYAELIQRIEESRRLRERMDAIAAPERQQELEDGEPELERDRAQIKVKPSEDWEARRAQINANIELLKMYAANGHLDTHNADIEDLIRRIRSGSPVPQVTGRGQQPELADRLDTDINVSADMPSRLQVGKVVSVACRLSRAEIENAAGKVIDAGQISADMTRLITVELLPKVNVEVVGEDRADVPVPCGQEVTEAYFDVRPTHRGACQVWVVVRQGPLPLLTLRLEAAAAAAQPAAVTVRRPTTAMVTIGAPTGMEEVNWLSVVEIDRGPDVIYRFELRSTVLGILASFESRPLRNRAAYIAGLYREIENRWLTSGEDIEEFQEELRDFGASLFSELFPEPLQEALWQQRDTLQHLMVLSSEPFIPWELVHLKEPGGPLPDETRFMAEIGLVRWLYTRDSSYPPQVLHARPGRVRILRPDYPRADLHLPHTLPEARFLLDKMGAVPVAPATQDVRRLLRTGSFDVLHFAGHGSADPDNIANAKILLQGRLEMDSYVPAYLSATAVAQHARLSGSDGSKPLVVLNACQAGRLGQQMTSLGGFAQAFLDRGAGAFISAMWSVGDAPASTFMQALYEGLLNGQPISAAATDARRQARLTGDGTWLAYAVYAHPHARLLTASHESEEAVP